jgi:hypothetical protein
MDLTQYDAKATSTNGCSSATSALEKQQENNKAHTRQWKLEREPTSFM